MAINVGLDIGTSAVRAAVVQTGKGVPVLQRYGQVTLPEGAVVAGEIVEEGIVRDALTELWKAAKLPKKRVIVGIANQRVIVRRVDLPYMAEDELARALPFQAQEYIPIPIDEAILDFVPLEEFATPNGEPMLSVLVVAAHRDMAADVMRVVGGAGIKVMAIDLQAFALARAAAMRGAAVTLVSGPVHLETPRHVHRIDVETAEQMQKAVLEHAPNAGVIIMAAAVGDFRPENPSGQKIKKDEGSEIPVVRLTKSPDILKNLGQKKNGGVLVGFALETENELENAREKLKKKNLDLVVLNSLKDEGAGFGTDTNIVTIIDTKGKEERLPRMSKFDVANSILDRVSAFLHKN